jgi:hypothetical protein
VWVTIVFPTDRFVPWGTALLHAAVVIHGKHADAKTARLASAILSHG